ncbi:MAG: biotin synthase [Rubrivivax sp.]|nr:MAG: biotin synthase [Rubrivivax sp.]
MSDKLAMILVQPRQWLDWGAFLGGGGAEVQARYPEARRWVLEPLPELGERSREQWRAQAQGAKAWWAPWRREVDPVVLANATEPAPWAEQGIQLLWANMALHAHPDLPQLLKQWHGILAVDGFLMCSGLGPDTARELRHLYRGLGWPPPTIDFIDMHDLGDALVEAGFANPVMDMERITLTWATADDMLAEWRTWGGNVAQGRFAGLRTPRWRARLLASLTQGLKRPDGRLGLTIELVYGHAFKPAPRLPVAAETRVSLGDMKAMIKHGTPKT